MMKHKQYVEIVKAVQKSRSASNGKNLHKQFPDIDQMTLFSIYSQEMQRRVKKSFHKINAPEMANHLYQSYLTSIECREPPGVLVRMAKELDYSPAMLSKMILEQYLSAAMPHMTISKSHVNRHLRDTTQIMDRDLSYEVYLCLLEDDVYGPFADSIKHSVGNEYEVLLRRKLEKLNIGYHDEDELRLKGYDKTPDIKLDVPIAVDGQVINWIESKASFGDEESHRGYLKDQFWSYWNRFGPGLVIYWFGFIEELDEHRDKGIMLRDSFPSNIVMMDPLSVA